MTPSGGGAVNGHVEHGLDFEWTQDTTTKGLEDSFLPSVAGFLPEQRDGERRPLLLFVSTFFCFNKSSSEDGEEALCFSAPLSGSSFSCKRVS